MLRSAPCSTSFLWYLFRVNGCFTFMRINLYIYRIHTHTHTYTAYIHTLTYTHLYTSYIHTLMHMHHTYIYLITVCPAPHLLLRYRSESNEHMRVYNIDVYIYYYEININMLLCAVCHAQHTLLWYTSCVFLSTPPLTPPPLSCCSSLNHQSWYTYEWGMAYLWMSHDRYMNEAWLTNEWAMAHLWISHGIQMNEQWHAYE